MSEETPTADPQEQDSMKLMREIGMHTTDRINEYLEKHPEGVRMTELIGMVFGAVVSVIIQMYLDTQGEDAIKIIFGGTENPWTN